MLVHDRGYLITTGPGGTFAFSRPDGTPLPSGPALPPPDGTIEDCHDAEIGPDTIIPPWYGERLDLDHAIYICLANEQNKARRSLQQIVLSARMRCFSVLARYQAFEALREFRAHCS